MFLRKTCFLKPSVYITVFFSFVATMLVAQRPSISSYSPRSGPVGTSVKILGDHFSLEASRNAVFFGPVRAVVQSATSTMLTVTVPAFAASQTITVTNTATGLTCSTTKPFQLTFPGGDDYLTENSFEKEVIVRIETEPKAGAVGDIDGDGKPDIALIGDGGGSGSYLWILRNTSSPRRLSFAAPIETDYDGPDGWALTLADINGDGMPDLIASSSRTLSIFKNTSTPGNIHFTLALETKEAPAYYSTLTAADMDNDGRTDLVFISNSTPMVMRNLSTSDTILFGNVEAVAPPGYSGYSRRLRLADFDDDGRPDIAMVYTYVDSIVVVHNNSAPGKFSFDQVYKYNVYSGSRPYDLTIADLDGDDKPDIAFTNNDYTYGLLLRNITTPGNLNFEHWTGFPLSGPVYRSGEIINGDINGDGKPDLAFAGFICCHTGTNVMMLNNSIPCKSVMNSLIVTDGGFPMGFYDMDGDGKPDFLGLKNTYYGVGILRNNIGQQFQHCAGDTATIPALIAGTHYQWQQNTGTGFASISDNALFSGSNGPMLQIKSIPASLDKTIYRCIADNDTSNVFTLNITSPSPPAITIGNCPTLSCSGDPSTVFYSTVLNAGSSAMYQWQDSTDAQGWKNIRQGNTDSLHYQATIDGAKIRCMLHSSSRCALPDSALSNTIVVRLSQSLVASNSITGTTTVEPGESTTLTASPVNGGNWPQYQWQDSTGTAGWANISGANNASIVYIPGKTGDKIRCVLRSVQNCAMPRIVNSNALAFTIGSVTPVDSLPTDNYRIRIFPNPATTVLNIDGLKLEDNWQTLEILTVNGQKPIIVSLVGVTSKTIDISGLPAGIYWAAFRTKKNLVAYSAFVKLGQ